MTKEQMKAFAAACRIKYGTAGAEDYKTVARYKKTYSKQSDHTSA
jgi:hypothetical protein